MRFILMPCVLFFLAATLAEAQDYTKLKLNWRNEQAFEQADAINDLQAALGTQYVHLSDLFILIGQTGSSSTHSPITEAATAVLFFMIGNNMHIGDQSLDLSTLVNAPITSLFSVKESCHRFDYNHNGFIDYSDFLTLASRFNSPDTGLRTTFADYLLLASHFGQPCT